MKGKRYWLAAVAILGVAGFWAVNPLVRGDHVATDTAVADLRVEVDLSARRLTVVDAGEVVRSYPVAIGGPSYPTPQGEFRIRRIIWNPRWVPPDAAWAKEKKPAAPGDAANPTGKVKIFFSEPDYYIHGTREEDSLGEAESHGCLRMRNRDVVALARTVMAAGGKPVSPSWTRRILNRIRSTSEVRLSAPVAITIRA